MCSLFVSRRNIHTHNKLFSCCWFLSSAMLSMVGWFLMDSFICCFALFLSFTIFSFNSRYIYFGVRFFSSSFLSVVFVSFWTKLVCCTMENQENQQFDFPFAMHTKIRIPLRIFAWLRWYWLDNCLLFFTCNTILNNRKYSFFLVLTHLVWIAWIFVYGAVSFALWLLLFSFFFLFKLVKINCTQTIYTGNYLLRWILLGWKTFFYNLKSEKKRL